jgi:NTP pyrophosphatase (non-canonical NTP hydrolase)
MLKTLDKLESLKKEVGQWSLENFGHNGLWDKNYLCAFMGIVEEFGELQSSVDEDEIKDSLADICIFALDFASRRNIDLSKLDIPSVSIDQEAVLPVAMILVGKLSHHLLKEIQGIRGYENKDFALERISETFAELLAMVDFICVSDFNCSMYDIAKATWDKIVSKRNWKATCQITTSAQTQI